MKQRKASEIQNAILKSREIHTKWTKFETQTQTHTIVNTNTASKRSLLFCIALKLRSRRTIM